MLIFTTEEKIMATKSALTERERRELTYHAEEKMAGPNYSVTFHKSPAASGDIHDYFSEGPYWWQNPDDPNGPYIRRDGEINPGRFTAHSDDIVRVSRAISVLASAAVYLDERRYSDRCAEMIRVWFLDEATKMNPNLNCAQAIRGVCDGRGIGIIDTCIFINVVHAGCLLEYIGGYEREVTGLKAWFAEYANWLETSKNGNEERNAENNHGIWYNAQLATYKAFVGEDPTPCFERFKSVIIPAQVEPDGSLPRELARTLSYHYTLYALEACAITCVVAQNYGEDLWSFTCDGERGVKKCIDFFKPYYINPFLWRHQQIIAKEQSSYNEAYTMKLAARIFGDKEIEASNAKRREGKIPMRHACHVGIVDLL